jgi:hypothetical protein
MSISSPFLKTEEGDPALGATSTSPITSTRRLNINLSERAHTELQQLSSLTNSSMTELIRLGVGLLKIALEARNHGHKLVVTTQDGQALKEIVLPG